MGRLVLLEAPLEGLVVQAILVGALVIALGMLVDNAIVMTESIMVSSRSALASSSRPARAHGMASSAARPQAWPTIGTPAVSAASPHSR